MKATLIQRARKAIICSFFIFLTLFSSLYTSPTLAATEVASCAETYVQKYKHLTYCASPLEIPNYEIVAEERLVCCDNNGVKSYEIGTCPQGSERVAPTYCEEIDIEKPAKCQLACEANGFGWWEGVEPLDNTGYCHCTNQQRSGTKEFSYFVYVNKPKEMTEDMVLEIKGLDSGWVVEALYPNTVTSSGNFIYVKASTSIIIHTQPKYENCQCQESVGCTCQGLNGDSTCSMACANYGEACSVSVGCVPHKSCSAGCMNSGSTCASSNDCKPKPASTLTLVPKKDQGGNWVNDETVKIVRSEDEEKCMNMVATVGYSLNTLKNSYLDETGILKSFLALGPALGTVLSSQIFSKLDSSTQLPELVIPPGKNVEVIYTGIPNSPEKEAFEAPSEGVEWLMDKVYKEWEIFEKPKGEPFKEPGWAIFAREDGKIILLDINRASKRGEHQIILWGKPAPDINQIESDLIGQGFRNIGLGHGHPSAPGLGFSAGDAMFSFPGGIESVYSFETRTQRWSVVDNERLYKAINTLKADVEKQLPPSLEFNSEEYNYEFSKIFEKEYPKGYPEIQGSFRDLIVKIGNDVYLPSGYTYALIQMENEYAFLRGLTELSGRLYDVVWLYRSTGKSLPADMLGRYSDFIDIWKKRLDAQDLLTLEMDTAANGLKTLMAEVLREPNPLSDTELLRYNAEILQKSWEDIPKSYVEKILELKNLELLPSEDSINRVLLSLDGAVEKEGEMNAILDHLASIQTNRAVSESAAKSQITNKLKNPKITAKMQIGALMVGLSVSLVQILGSALREKAELYADTTYLYYANLVETIGWADLALTIGLTIATEAGIILPAWVSAMWVVSLGNPAMLLVGILSGYVIGMFIQAIIDYFDCLWHPWSEACGCSIDPQFGKLQLNLENSEGPPDGKINFNIYGMQYCENPTSGKQAYYGTIEYYDESAKIWKSVHNELVYPLTSLPKEFKCRFVSSIGTLWQGSCCEAMLDLSKTVLQPGTYKIRGRFCRISEGELTSGSCCESGCAHYDYERCNPMTCRCEYIEPYYCYSDSAYITEEKTLTVGTEITELTSIPLKQGYNMISTPYSTVTFDTSSCTLFSKAYHYHPTASSIYDTIDVGDMEGGVGYWVYSYSKPSCEIKLSGQANPISEPTEFSAGWNQVAIPLEGLKKDRVQCDQIEDPKTWNTETGNWVFAPNMVPGKSYFVDCYPAR